MVCFLLFVPECSKNRSHFLCPPLRVCAQALIGCSCETWSRTAWKRANMRKKPKKVLRKLPCTRHLFWELCLPEDSCSCSLLQVLSYVVIILRDSLEPADPDLSGLSLDLSCQYGLGWQSRDLWLAVVTVSRTALPFLSEYCQTAPLVSEGTTRVCCLPGHPLSLLL